MSDLSQFMSTRNDKWSPELWDGLITAIGGRLAPLEEQLNIQKEVSDAIISRGLTVIEQELTPIVKQADQMLEDTNQAIDAKLIRLERKVTGGMLLSYSTTSAQLAVGITINLIIAQEDREFFAPTPYLALSRASTIENWAIAKLKSFNRVTGALSLLLEQVTIPGGPFNDWVVTSLPAAAMLQKGYFEQTSALRDAVMRDKEETGQAAAASSSAAKDSKSSKDAAQLASRHADEVLKELREVISKPVETPVQPLIGQIWYDGAVMRVYDGVSWVPAVTVSLGGIRTESGIFGVDPDGIIIVGGGFTVAKVFVNGTLLSESQYTADSPEIQILNPQAGDRYYVDAYLTSDAIDYATKSDVSEQISNKFIRYDVEQELSDPQRKMACKNSGAVSLEGDSGLGGFKSVGKNLGNLAGKTLVLSTDVSNFQYGVNNGNFTLSAPPDGFYSLSIKITNVAGAGAGTFLGFAPPLGKFSNAVGKVQRLIIDVNGNNKLLMIVEAS